MHADLNCQQCGACCAHFRVAFYWGEADDAPGGHVPSALTESLRPNILCMQGTSAKKPRCVALHGEIGHGVACGIYTQRPTPCREVMPGDPQCLRARQSHGLPI